MAGIMDSIKSMAESVAYPNKDAETSHAENTLEHDAAQGVTANHEPPSGLWDELHGDAGVHNMKTHGNIGEGSGSGLATKAVKHQEELAERTRLKREGLFESHTTHDDLINKSERHREVAGGSTAFGGGDDGADDERLV